MVWHLDDAKQWRFCAEELRTAAENMLSEQCREMTLRVADGYDRLAQHAEERADAPRARSMTQGDAP
jgi:hypothetical protein